MARSKTESAESKVKSAVALGSLGGAIAGPIGAGVGAVTGLIIGDDTTVFPIDMVAVPAFEYPGLRSNINMSPSFMVYIKAGETLVPTGGNVADMSENMDIEAVSQSLAPKKKRKRSKWNIYASKKSNQIKFKSGKKKGLLNLKAMGKAYRRRNK